MCRRLNTLRRLPLIDPAVMPCRLRVVVGTFAMAPPWMDLRAASYAQKSWSPAWCATLPRRRHVRQMIPCLYLFP